MLGAHLDSWHSGTGAADSAAGSAVMMEAMRILRAPGMTSPAHDSDSIVEWGSAGTPGLPRVGKEPRR